MRGGDSGRRECRRIASSSRSVAGVRAGRYKISMSESTWGVTGNTLAILQQIEALGLIVSVHRLKGSLLGTFPPAVEMHALWATRDPPKTFVARVDLQESDEPDYACAVLLEEMVGTELFG